MQRITRLVQTNIIIAITITLIVYLLYPSMSQYNWGTKTFKSNASSLDFVVDVDSEGEREYLKISDNGNTFGSISLYTKDNLLLDLSNLPFNIFTGGHQNVLIENLDNNQFDDILFLGEKKDSLYLVVIEYKNGKSAHPSIKSFYLDHIKAFQDKYLFNSKIVVNDLDSDGIQDVIVLISSGYTILPRRLYTVNVVENKVKKSPISGAVMTDFHIVDINNDGKKEVIVNTDAYCNIYDETFSSTRIDTSIVHDSELFSQKDVLLRYNDCSAWLIVFDENLNYVFKPKAYEGWTGKLNTIAYNYEGQDVLLSIYSNNKDSIRRPRLLIHDLHGFLIKEKELEADDKLIMPLDLQNSIVEIKNQVCFSDGSNQLFEIGDDLEISSINDIMPDVASASIVESGLADGKLIIEFKDNYLVVYDYKLKELTREFFPGIQPLYLYASIQPISQQEDLLMVDLGTVKVQFRIEKNSYYFFRYLAWLIVFAFVWLVLELIKGAFSYRSVQERRKFERIVEERTEQVQKQKDDLKIMTVDLKEKNDMVFQQNQELKKRREEIESLFDKLSSSITYGKGIKDALLPSDNEFKKIFPESFSFFQPHNVLGGDFYWMEEKNNRKILIVGDASGQGVSGAFLSLLAISVLNDIHIDESTEASSVLSSINAMIYKHLSSYLKSSEDGIEMGVVIFDQKDELIDVQFSSANIPLYYFESNTILDMKKIEPNDFCIRADVSSLSFANQCVTVPKETMFYMATKGLYIQKGVINQEPFGKIQFRTNLMRIHVLSIEDQKKILIEKFEKWQGINEQTDDVLCIGVRV